ncbi:MAG TPA: hypothetical protein DCY40_08090 [Actinobacteria bacterium]|nr:hypothetical protein [Actinomycetota bacterium]
MDASRHRWLIIALATAFAALVVAVIVFYPSGDPAALPAPLESVYPKPGDVLASPAEVVIELPPGYVATIVVDGRPVPPSEVVAVTATGTFRWRPGPGGSIERWEPGEHTVEVSWDRLPSQVPDPGAFAWTFRVI